MNKYYWTWSINQKLNNPDISRYVSTFIFYKPIKKDIMKLKIKNEEFKDMKDGYGSIENWNVLKVRTMEDMFSDCKNFNQDISKWNVQNVQTMEDMFNNCENFNKTFLNGMFKMLKI